MSDQKLSTKALHAGHDTSLTQGTRAVPLYHMYSMTLIMLPIFLLWLNQGIFIRD